MKKRYVVKYRGQIKTYDTYEDMITGLFELGMDCPYTMNAISEGLIQSHHYKEEGLEVSYE